MKGLGEDWYAVGDLQFRNLHLFDMSWGVDFSLSCFEIAVAQYSGHIALLLKHGGSKPILQVFSASGKLVAQQLWKDAEPLSLGWSLTEELLVVQKNGFIAILDLFGIYLRRFSMGTEVEQRGIIDAKIFNMSHETGVAVLISGNRVFLTSSIETPRIKRIAELSSSSTGITCWQVINGPLELPSRGSGSSDHFRGPWLLMGRKKFVYRADFTSFEEIDLSTLATALASSPSYSIDHIAVSNNLKSLAFYASSPNRPAGWLIVSNLQLTNCLLSLDLSLTSLQSEMLTGQGHNDDRPLAMLWSTNSAVVLQWKHTLVLIGPQGDLYELFCPPSHLSQEVDGVRLLTTNSHELIQRVPPALESIGRIGASCPATWLLAASSATTGGGDNSSKPPSRIINDYLAPIRANSQTLVEAVSHCLEAANHAAGRRDQHRRDLLKAARLGRILVAGNDKIGKYDVKLRDLANQTVDVCRTLRALTSLAAPWIGISLTWTQFQSLGANRLLDRLLQRKAYPAALAFVHTYYWKHSSSGTTDSDSQSPLGSAVSQILSHWACNSPSLDSSVSPNSIDKVLTVILPRLVGIDTSTPDGNNEEVRRTTIGRTLLSRLNISLADIAGQALLAGRDALAEQLTSYEPQPSSQVRLFVKLGRYSQALRRAVDTGNPELIAYVVGALKAGAKLPPADLQLVLRRHPMAVAIYHEMFGSNSSDGSSTSSGPSDADDRVTQAGKTVQGAYKENNLKSKLAALQTAEDTYKKANKESMSQECSLAARLFQFQGKLESQALQAPIVNIEVTGPNLVVPQPVDTEGSSTNSSWVGQPLSQTLLRLIASPHLDRQADQLRREFKVTDKRFALTRLLGLAVQGREPCLAELDKMIKLKRPPVPLEVLVKISIDLQRFEYAHNLISKLPPNRRARYWYLSGRLEDALRSAVSEKSDPDLIFIQLRIGKQDRATYDRVSALRSQILS